MKSKRLLGQKRILAGVLLMAFLFAGSCLALCSRPADPAKAVNASTQVLYPEERIFFDSFGEEDFTCTGMTWDDKNGLLWIADSGYQRTGEDSAPRLLEVDLDQGTVVKVLDLVDLWEDSYDLQGISYDRKDDSLWIAVGNRILELSKDGKALAELSLGRYGWYRANGIAVNGEDIWVLCYRRWLLRLDRNGTVMEKVRFNFRDQDQICFCNDCLYCTVGADYTGDENYVFTYDPITGELRNAYRAEGSQSLEGIVVQGDDVYIVNDGNYHNDTVGRSYICRYLLK